MRTTAARLPLAIVGAAALVLSSAAAHASEPVTAPGAEMKSLGVAGDATESTRELVRVKRINSYFNSFRAVSDRELWGLEEYWAAPAQFVARRSGDCEDFALAKYDALLRGGVAPIRLWLAPVRTVLPRSRRIESHMVVIYQDPHGRRWVLDNLSDSVRPMERRSDLSFAAGMNNLGMWRLSKTVEPTRIGGPDALPVRVQGLLAITGRLQRTGAVQ